ncbi:MAG: hypothetical protein HS111_14010 [Kofleriaceae bacterium]|nr:hypothetical protein [Kofleriaceae bacterium]
MAHVRDHVASGRLRGLAVTATSDQSGQAISFFDGHPAIEPWTRAGRVGQRARLSVEHVLASAAIPVLFPPVTVGGAALGDGCIRPTAPLSPAIHLGAERIVAIGIQAAGEPPAHDRAARPTPAEIGGVLLNAVFLDSLEADAERHLRINSTLAAMAPAQRAAQALREIPLLVLRPSVDLGQLAVEQYRELPVALRYLLRGIGADGQRGWDLVSYLAFEPVYVQRLVELGYRGTCARRDDS